MIRAQLCFKVYRDHLDNARDPRGFVEDRKRELVTKFVEALHDLVQEENTVNGDLLLSIKPVIMSEYEYKKLIKAAQYSELSGG